MTNARISKMKRIDNKDRLLLCDFEAGVPDTAEIRHIRLDADRRVVSASGCDAEGTSDIMWLGNGEAYVHIRQQKGTVMYPEPTDDPAEIINGKIYRRNPDFDSTL